MAVKKQARREADLEAYLMRELAVLKHFQHENLLQYVGASNAAAAEPGGGEARGGGRSGGERGHDEFYTERKNYSSAS